MSSFPKRLIFLNSKKFYSFITFQSLFKVTNYYFLDLYCITFNHKIIYWENLDNYKVDFLMVRGENCAFWRLLFPHPSPPGSLEAGFVGPRTAPPPPTGSRGPRPEEPLAGAGLPVNPVRWFPGSSYNQDFRFRR